MRSLLGNEHNGIIGPECYKNILSSESLKYGNLATTFTH